MLEIFEEVMAEGMLDGKTEAVLDLLSGMGTVPDELRQIIKRQRDQETLKNWLRLAARAESIEAFCAEM